MEKYNVIEEGNTKGFCKGCNILTSGIVTLKQLGFHNVEGVPASLIKEISLLKELNHANIIRLIDVFNSDDQISMTLVYEYFDTRFMLNNRKVIKIPHTIKEFLRQILLAVSFYHSYNIIHGQIKPQNIFIDPATNILKITDYIWPRSILNYDKGDPNEESNYCYNAPEILIKQKQFTTALDIWSVGCVFAEMVINKPLFPATTDFHQLMKIFSIMGIPSEETWPGFNSLFEFSHLFSNSQPKDLVTLVPGLEPDGIDLLYKLLCMDPNRRITATQALQHEYLQM